jgi:ABC-2 type transport system permease protein
MHNILRILKHEFITRVSKKSFIIMTLLGPVLIALFYGSILAISFFQLQESNEKIVSIYDPSNALQAQINNSNGFNFQFIDSLQFGLDDLNNGSIDLLLDIDNQNQDSVHLIAKKSLSLSDKEDLKNILSSQYFNTGLKQRGLNIETIDSLKHKIKITDDLISGKSSATEIKSGIGYAGAFIIYLFIFMYGVMIMRGVTEEKNNRIVEIIISAVKPFQLMMGKILGVALVGLTQFLAWIVLSGILITILSIAIGAETIDQDALVQAQGKIQQSGSSDMLQGILSQFQSLNYTKLIVGFILFFFGGFLLYSSLFAAIGSAVDSDTETQQFMFPVSMPLIFGLIIAQIAVIKDPNSTLAVWSSMIPFTSPVVMMVRLPFDVSWFEIISSAAILFASFIVVVWLAAKIYRIGILSYGQKASYKQMFKWLRTKN